MTVLYVTSDEPKAGKSAFCIALAKALGDGGKRAAVFKPFTSEAEPADDPDQGTYEHLLGQAAQSPPLPLPGGIVAPDLIEKAAAETAKDQDVLQVEGLSQMPDSDAAALVEAMDAKVLLVVRFRAGLDADSLARWRDVYGDRLIGYVVNGLTRYQGTEAHTNLLPSMESRGLRVLGVVPEDRKLLGVSVGQLATKLEGRFVRGEDRTDGLVEHYLVGGLGLDSGELYFGLRESKAAIVRGDRPDIQMAALQTRTACMVLTKGIEPIEYILNEAELEEVPIIIVETDTLGTMESLVPIVEETRFDHPDKLAAFGDLLDEHVDLDALFKVLGLDG